MVAAMLTATLVLVPAISIAQSNRLIINRGASQQAAVSLTPDSSVSIDAVTGNVVVDCAPNTGDPTQCADSLGGGGSLPPAFTLASSNFSQNPVQGAYPPLTTFTLAPVGTLHASYEVCQRITTGGAGQTNWSGFVPPAGAGGTVTLPSPESTYNFALRCFAAGGARTSNLLNLVTGPGSVSNCPNNWNGEAWGAFGRKPGENRFTDLFNQATGGTAGEFPNLEGLAIFGAAIREYVTVEFTAVPRLDLNGDGLININDFNSMSKLFSWIESQSGFYAGQANLTQGVYFSISKCPGDFRLPPASNVPDPNDPTLNLGCRNIGLFGGTRFLTGAIQYAINQSPNNLSCALAYGERYYINFMTVNPLDGYQTNEHNCDSFALNGSGRCGVAFQSQ